MTISIIVAIAENNVIGKDNKLLWRLPADLKYFKELTMGHHIIMGRKTFESIGKPLKDRTNIIITKNILFRAEGCIIVNSLKWALEIAEKKGETEVFIIGGGEIYKQALPLTNKIYLTKIFHRFEGDTFFPTINENEWILEKHEEHLPDEKNKFPYAFCTYLPVGKQVLESNHLIA